MIRKSIVTGLIVFLIAGAGRFARAEGEVIQENNIIIPIDSSMQPVSMTEITSEDWLYIKGKFRRSNVAFPCCEVKTIQRVLNAPNDAIAKIPKDPDNLQGETVSIPLTALVRYWPLIESRVQDGRFNPSTRRLLYSFKNDPTIAQSWKWAPEIATYYLAQQYFSDKNYDGAAELYKELVDKYPTSRFRIDAALKIGQTYMEAQQFDKADQAFSDAKDNVIKDYMDKVKEKVHNADDLRIMRAHGRKMDLMAEVYQARNAKSRAVVSNDQADILEASRKIEAALGIIEGRNLPELETMLLLDRLDLWLLSKEYDRAVKFCQTQINDWKKSGSETLEKRMPYIYMALADTRRIRAMENAGTLQATIDMNWARWYYMHVVIGFPDNEKVIEKSLYYTGWTYLMMKDWGEETNDFWKVYWQRLADNFNSDNYRSKYLDIIEQNYPTQYGMLKLNG